MANRDTAGTVDVVIVGGGLAGLTAAVYAARAGRRVLVLEKAGMAGGRARSRTEAGFVLNEGPHALYRGGAGLRVLREIGVPVSGRVPRPRGLALRNGRAHRLPAGPGSLALTRLFGPAAKLEVARLLAGLPSRDVSGWHHVPLRDWADERLHHADARAFLHAVVRVATYTDDPGRISAGAAIEQVQRALRDSVLYLDGGPREAAGLVGSGRAPALHAFAEAAIPVRAATLDLGLRALPRPDHTFALGIDRPLYFSVHSATARLAPAGGGGRRRRRPARGRDRGGAGRLPRRGLGRPRRPPRRRLLRQRSRGRPGRRCARRARRRKTAVAVSDGLKTDVHVEREFQAHRAFLWGLTYRLTGNTADADDVVQETFVRALQHPPRRPQDPWRPWLVRVALNLGRDLLRKRRRRDYVGPWLPSPVPTGGDAPAPPEPAADAHDSPAARYDRLESVSFAFLVALEALTPVQRAVLLLRDVFDYSVREAADALEMTEGAVKAAHLRGRKAMSGYERTRRRPTRAVQ